MQAKTSPRAWTVMVVVFLMLTIWFLLPQLSVVIFTALMAFVFYPLYRRLKRKKGGAAAAVTLLISFLVVLIPLAFITVATVSQLASFAESASQSNYWNTMPEFVTKVIDITNDILAPLTGTQSGITDQSVIDFLKTTLPTLARNTAALLFNILSSLPQLGIALLVYIFLFVEFLRYGPELVEKIELISPLGPDVTKKYLERIGLMAKAMVTGQLIISMIISAFGAGLLALIGYGQFFFIFFAVLTVLNFIPLGGGVLLIPLSLYAMFTGQPWLGLLVIVLYYLFGNIEPILRARLIPEKIQLSVGLTMLATFCGIAYFGLLGVVYGPIIMIVIITTFQFYLDLKSKRPAPPVREA